MELVRVVAPPDDPPRRRDWAEIENELGRLPADYKHIIDTYGPGRFRSCIRVWSPEQILDRRRQLGNLLGMLKFYSGQGAYSVDVAPLGVGAEAVGGVDDFYLPWGEGRRGTIGLWRTTRGTPNGWPVLLMSLGAIDYESGGLAAYLVGNLTGRFRSIVVDNDIVQARSFESETPAPPPDCRDVHDD
ncbi:hypothetical protein [Tsukamurella sp. NPDC003166]|uniref:hypothetical protein n=1 Tax=Tsukamurella sp. NPDC003166 TaxID=3154444 RepID=UPI0033BBDD91